MAFGANPNAKIQQMLASLSPEQRAMMLQSALAGASQGLLSAPRGAGAGTTLAAIGAGALGGQQQGLQGIMAMRGLERQERSLDLEEEALRARQTAAQREQEAAARKQAIIESLPPEQKQLYELFGAQARDLIHPKQQTMTPYQEAMVGIARDRLAHDRSKPGGGSDGTALVQNAQYLAKVKGISEGEAADFLLQSSTARSNPEKTRDDIFKIMLRENYGDAAEAWSETDKAMRLLEGGAEALPKQPQQGPEKGAWAALKEWWGTGGGEEAAATPEQPAEAAQAPTAQPPRPVAGAALPADPSGLQAGQTYQLPDGRIAVFDGQQFEVIE